MKFCVYYMQQHFDELQPKAEFFDDLRHALSFATKSRDEGYKFVALVSDLSENVTKMGVSCAPEDYNWTKRR